MVTGRLVDHRLAFLRGEMGSLQRLARRRLDAMPMLMPFGTGVTFAVSGAMPDDERCRVLLAGFMPDEPDWVRQWWELDLWCRLEACARHVLSHVLVHDDGRVEIADPDSADSFVMAVRAVALIADHRFGAEGDHGWVACWLRHIADMVISS